MFNDWQFSTTSLLYSLSVQQKMKHETFYIGYRIVDPKLWEDEISLNTINIVISSRLQLAIICVNKSAR